MNQNPTYEKGYRNVLCPSYWDYWSCLDCRLKERENLKKDVSLSQWGDDTYYSLSPSIYQKVRKYSF
jgi:hypothetical protein